MTNRKTYFAEVNDSVYGNITIEVRSEQNQWVIYSPEIGGNQTEGVGWGSTKYPTASAAKERMEKLYGGLKWKEKEI